MVTITPTVTQSNAGGTSTVSRMFTVDLTQHFCDTSGAQDQLVDVAVGATYTGPKYAQAFENGEQKAKASADVVLNGTITFTPAGHNGTCAVATGPSITDSYSSPGKVSASWEALKGSAPATTTTPDTYTVTRPAVAQGSLEFKPLFLKHELRSSAASGAVLSVVSHTTDGSDPHTIFVIKP